MRIVERLLDAIQRQSDCADIFAECENPERARNKSLWIYAERARENPRGFLHALHAARHGLIVDPNEGTLLYREAPPEGFECEASPCETLGIANALFECYPVCERLIAPESLVRIQAECYERAEQLRRALVEHQGSLREKVTELHARTQHLRAFLTADSDGDVSSLALADPVHVANRFTVLLEACEVLAQDLGSMLSSARVRMEKPAADFLDEIAESAVIARAARALIAQGVSVARAQVLLVGKKGDRGSEDLSGGWLRQLLHQNPAPQPVNNDQAPL